VRVPDDAGKGYAKVTVSIPDWKQGKVAPATFEVPTAEATLTFTGVTFRPLTILLLFGIGIWLLRKRLPRVRLSVGKKLPEFKCQGWLLVLLEIIVIIGAWLALDAAAVWIIDSPLISRFDNVQLGMEQKEAHRIMGTPNAAAGSIGPDGTERLLSEGWQGHDVVAWTDVANGKVTDKRTDVNRSPSFIDWFVTKIESLRFW
jgi:hypothetical protein